MPSVTGLHTKFIFPWNNLGRWQKQDFSFRSINSKQWSRPLHILLNTGTETWMRWRGGLHSSVEHRDETTEHNIPTVFVAWRGPKRPHREWQQQANMTTCVCAVSAKDLLNSRGCLNWTSWRCHSVSALAKILKWLWFRGWKWILWWNKLGTSHYYWGGGLVQFKIWHAWFLLAKPKSILRKRTEGKPKEGTTYRKCESLLRMLFHRRKFKSKT